jgi:small subunit ribosomal protein S2
MNHNYGGIKDMTKPGVVFIADILNDVNALREARKLHIPVVAIVDTNTDPSLVDYPIPANDDAIKSVKLIVDYVQKAIEAGKAKIKELKPDKEAK